MLILGLETSCDETAASVVVDGRRVLSSVVASQNDLHARYGGVVPELASRAHLEALVPVVEHAVADAGVTLADLDAIAVGHRPGLIGSLLVGVSAAKALAWGLGKPLIGVDHVHSHLYAGNLIAREAPLSPEPRFPALGLVVSGGHTSIYILRSWNDLQRLGATIDDAVGEAYDKAAMILGLPHPGGPNLDALAATGGGNDRALELPISRIAPGSLDFSFSGLKTALLYAVRGVPFTRGSPGRLPPPPPESLTDSRRADLAACFQRAACAAVMLKLTRAFDQLAQRGDQPLSLLTGGGVTANSRLRAQLAERAASWGVPLFLPAMQYCVDNAAMIAGLGGELLRAGRVADLNLQPVPTTAC